MEFKTCSVCRIKFGEDSITEFDSGHKLCVKCSSNDRFPIREGTRLKDIKYGPVEILAVTEKRVWYNRLLNTYSGGIYHTSKQRAKEFLSEGPEWAEGPRWELESAPDKA